MPILFIYFHESLNLKGHYSVCNASSFPQYFCHDKRKKLLILCQAAVWWLMVVLNMFCLIMMHIHIIIFQKSDIMGWVLGYYFLIVRIMDFRMSYNIFYKGLHHHPVIMLTTNKKAIFYTRNEMFTWHTHKIDVVRIRGEWTKDIQIAVESKNILKQNFPFLWSTILVNVYI